MNEDTQPFAEWVGRSETTEDHITAAPAQAAAATLDDQSAAFASEDELPPLSPSYRLRIGCFGFRPS